MRSQPHRQLLWHSIGEYRNPCLLVFYVLVVENNHWLLLKAKRHHSLLWTCLNLFHLDLEPPVPAAVRPWIRWGHSDLVSEAEAEMDWKGAV